MLRQVDRGRGDCRGEAEGWANVKRRVEFRRLVERFQNECRERGVELSTAAAEDFLVDRVKSMAEALGVREETVVRSHLRGIDVASLAAAFKQADEARRREVADASPVVLSLSAVGTLVASLGQAVRCVSLNHDVLNEGEAAKWEAISVLDDAGNGLTLLGAALGDAVAGSGAVSVLVSDEAVVYARGSLTQTVNNVDAGRWSFNRDRPEVDAGVVKRMRMDLALLPPAATST
jgi:hypothetical protein